MTGLENIIKQIESDAAARAEEITAKASSEAAETVRAAEEQAEEISADYARRIEKKAAEIAERAQSSDALERSRSILLKKQEIIRDFINRTKCDISESNPEKYFGLMEKLLDKYAQSGSGYIIMSEKDKKRTTKAFTAAIEKHKLTISEENGAADGGFILVYGSIEVNCTLGAIFDALDEELSDMLNSFLYGTGGV